MKTPIYLLLALSRALRRTSSEIVSQEKHISYIGKKDG